VLFKLARLLFSVTSQMEIRRWHPTFLRTDRASSEIVIDAMNFEINPS
jgi:hypothetical protein